MKKLMFSLAVCTLALASCQQDEVVEMSFNDPNLIQFANTTTRASIYDLSTLTGDAGGFKVYGTSNASTTAWYAGIDGSATYRYLASSWGWSTGSPQWPTVASSYPMNFYAYYPLIAAGFTPTATPSPMIISGAFSIQTTAATQKDFLAAKALTASKPGNGKLTMAFNHILSKVNFGVIAGTGTTVKVQSVTVNNVKNTGAYNYMAGTWGTPSGVGAYTYQGTVITGGAGGVAVLPTFTPAIANETTASPFYAGTHSNHLMLMPQITACWDKSAIVANAYAGVIYRMSTATEPDAIGYTNATDHPNYTSGYAGPLFVKVGFPFAAGNLTWDMSKGYTYNFYLGTANASNGYVADTNYYDDKGNRTPLPIVGKNIGDPISDGTINFNVNVTDWVDQPAAPLN